MDPCQKKANCKRIFTAPALQGFDMHTTGHLLQADGRGPGLTASRNL